MNMALAITARWRLRNDGEPVATWLILCRAVLRRLPRLACSATVYCLTATLFERVVELMRQQVTQRRHWRRHAIIVHVCYHSVWRRWRNIDITITRHEMVTITLRLVYHRGLPERGRDTYCHALLRLTLLAMFYCY